MYKVILMEEAGADIIEARSYYKSLVIGLEKRFKLDLKKIINKLEENPYIFGFRFSEFRTVNLPIFPYQIHYKILEENKTIIIFAVLHAYRDPNFIKSRNIQ